MKIITISREFGSGGRYLGERIAKRLGMEFYDKDIIVKTAKETGLSEKYIEEAGEYAPGKNSLAYAFVGRNRAGTSLEDYMYSVQRRVILEAAAEGPCVIVGRCADYVLKGSGCLNVFICGNKKNKLERIVELYKVSPEEAERLMYDTDKKRSIHYKYYAEQDWGAARNYTLCLNSSETGYDRCMDIICSLAEGK